MHLIVLPLIPTPTPTPTPVPILIANPTLNPKPISEKIDEEGRRHALGFEMTDNPYLSKLPKHERLGIRVGVGKGIGVLDIDKDIGLGILRNIVLYMPFCPLSRHSPTHRLGLGLGLGLVLGLWLRLGLGLVTRQYFLIHALPLFCPVTHNLPPSHVFQPPAGKPM